ncbi:hypothetical protein Pla110_20020 [Polystyrenella longa]|uniref:Uncharacterized protein n=1 Tax=Polystyrenella longa TaxID=2528007 RepID=A0A518CM27_9PLAN|nr:hypothetical protein Pla110_20020 [Polystyrenella longa]
MNDILASLKRVTSSEKEANSLDQQGFGEFSELFSSSKLTEDKQTLKSVSLLKESNFSQRHP